MCQIYYKHAYELDMNECGNDFNEATFFDVHFVTNWNHQARRRKQSKGYKTRQFEK